jgi:hypothetical protein
MTNKQIVTSSDIEALRAECLRLRQGLWDCALISGADGDGCKTPEPLVSDIVKFATEAVSDLRGCYDTALVSLI